MKKIMVVVAVLIAHGLFAQEIDVQELFKKIEQKNSGLRNLKAQAFGIFTSPYYRLNDIFVVDAAYLKDEFLSFDVLVKEPRIGSGIINYIYLKDGLAFKFTSASHTNYTPWGMLPLNLNISLAAKGQETYTGADFFSVLSYLMYPFFHLYTYATLLDLNLIPSKVFRGKQLQVEKIRENGKEYVLIKYTVTLPDTPANSTQVACYLNLKELVFERITMTPSYHQEPRLIIEVEKFNNINNVPLPQLIIIRDRSSYMVAKIIFKSFQTNLDKIEQPYWLSDKNLPELTKETSREIASKIEKDHRNVKLILQYLTTKFFEIQNLREPELFDEFLEEYESMLSELKEIKTDSVLVNDMELVSLIKEEELGKCEEKLKQINYSSPHAIYLFALELVKKKKEPSQFLEKIKQESIIKETILSEYKISQIKTLQELQNIFEGKTFEEKLFLCERMGTLRIRYIPSKKLVEEMEKKAEDDFIKLLLARYFARKRKNEKASQYYVQLPDELFKFVQSEVENLAKKGATAELMHRVIKTTKDVELLLKYALENIKSKEIDAIVKKIIELIEVAKSFMPHEREEQLIELIEKLLDEGKNDLSKQLLSAVIKQSHSFRIYYEGIADIIEKVTNNNKEEIYEIVKHNLSYVSHIFEIPDEEIKDIVMKKIKEEKADETDFGIFAEKMKIWRLQDALNILEKAYEKFPSNIKIQEALADQYAESKQYERAIKLYRNVLSSVSGSKGSYSYTEGLDEFNSALDILIKFAFVAGKLDSESAVKEIAKYEERYHPYVVAQAYEVLGKHDIAWEKCKKYILSWISPSSFSFSGSEFNILFNFARRAGEELEAYMISEIFLDKKLVKRRSWIKETIEKAKRTLGITQEHFIDYILKQSYEDVGQDDKQRAETLIKQLDSDSLEEREQATQELIKMGKKIVPLLKEHLDSPFLEVQVRVKDILYKIGYDELKQQLLQENK